MQEFITIQQIDEAVKTIKEKTSYQPTVGLILGSGLGDLADSVKAAEFLEYKEIPGWPVSTIEGHKGRLVIGELEGTTVLIMQGRAHYYEGYPITQVGFPIRVMRRLGIETLIVTNAAGAINPDYKPGDVMTLTDHLSLMAMGGENPLRGPNLDEFGPRFPDMSRCYDPALIELAGKVCQEKNILLHKGVYVCLAGPSFETPADLRFLKIIGADAVGMSTVPECIAARHCGMKTLGITLITNMACGILDTPLSEEEVMIEAVKARPYFSKLVLEFIKEVDTNV